MFCDDFIGARSIPGRPSCCSEEPEEIRGWWHDAGQCQRGVRDRVQWEVPRM